MDSCKPGHDAGADTEGDEHCEWVVENAANYAIEKALEQKDGQDNLTWGEYVRRGSNKSPLI